MASSAADERPAAADLMLASIGRSDYGRTETTHKWKGTSMSKWRHMRRGLIGLVAAAAISGSPAGDVAAAPPIDPDSFPPAGEELSDEAAEQLFNALGGVVATGPVSGSSSLTGVCGGVAFSYDSDGNLIDAAYDAGDDAPPIDLIDGGQAFTSDNRYKVDTNGTVNYFGFAPRSGDGPMDYDYELKVAGITVASEFEPNSAGNNRNGGTIDLASDLPFAFDALIDASGTLDGSFSCAGEGKVEFVGNGLVSIPGGIGVLVLTVGLVGIFVNARPARTWKG
jgi:hypothetical protein